MTLIAYTSINNNNIPTTFQRFLNGSSILMSYKNLTKIAGVELDFKRKYLDEKILAHRTYTNFELEVQHSKWEEKESLLAEGLDFYIPLKPKKSFVINANIVSVTKFSPKPFFE